jgi:acetyl esterase/lipase
MEENVVPKKRWPFLILLFMSCVWLGDISAVAVQIPEAQALWPDGIKDNPIVYKNPEQLRSYDADPGSPTGTCNVYSHVSTPSFTLYQPDPHKNAGMGIVIYPGGGYRDIWLDKEGHDYALFLREHGITSLVLTYRTNTNDENGNRSFSDKVYRPAVLADAQEAIATLRRRANTLGIDPEKIGVMGSSAGGHLALSVSFAQDRAESLRRANFACLVYPGVHDNYKRLIRKADDLPPMFIINGGEDDVTPPINSINLYLELRKHKVPAELHIAGKGGHGFGLSLGSDTSASLWTNSFLAWLKDMEFLNK